MTVVRIVLPEDLVQEAASAGLLAPDAIERMLRERLRAARLERLAEARSRLAAEPLAPMTADEINAEIAAYRASHPRAAGS